MELSLQCFSKLVSTHLWNTHLNLYLKAKQAFLSLLKQPETTWGCPGGLRNRGCVETTLGCFFFSPSHPLPSYQEVAISQQSRGPWKTGRAAKVLGRTGSTLRNSCWNSAEVLHVHPEKKGGESLMACYVMYYVCFFLCCRFYDHVD